MKFKNIKKGCLPVLQTVVFLAIALFPITSSFAQEVSLKVLKSEDMFLGVENLVQVSVPGIPNEKIFIGSDGVDIEKLDNGIFKLGFHYPGKTTLTVHGEGFQYKNFDVEVKRIPDPMNNLADPVAGLQLANGQIMRDGEISASDFQKAMGVGFVKDALTGNTKFEVVSFSVVWVRKDTDPAEVPCKSANFSERAKALVNAAQTGDSFYFENVMVKAPNETEPRKVNSLVFRIK